MTRPTPFPLALREGVFSTAEAEALGLDRHRIQADDVHHLGRGLHVHVGAVSRIGVLDVVQALQRRFPDAVADGTTAAFVWDFPIALGPADVGAVDIGAADIGPVTLGSTSRTMRRTSDALVRWSRRVLREGDVVRHPGTGLRVTTPARTWADLASMVTSMELAIVADHMLCAHDEDGHPKQPLQTPAELRRAVYLAADGTERLRTTLERASDRSPTPARTCLRRALSLLEPSVVNAPLIADSDDAHYFSDPSWHTPLISEDGTHEDDYDDTLPFDPLAPGAPYDALPGLGPLTHFVWYREKVCLQIENDHVGTPTDIRIMTDLRDSRRRAEMGFHEVRADARTLLPYVGPAASAHNAAATAAEVRAQLRRSQTNGFQ
jgi:hypothetical protein